jgi:FMN phosphatase YigB (HAD superfamily)
MRRPELQALLLDLDDTLLGNSMETFIPAYFKAMTDFVTQIQPPERLIEQLLVATRIMDRNDGTGETNEQVFSREFFAGLGLDRSEIEPVFERFYAEAFPGLRPLTRPRPAAPTIVEWAQERGFAVVIATNPMFPLTAIEQRMEWAEVGVDRFDYALVTSYETSRATKSHPAYYREILEVIGCEPAAALMVGDNWEWDIVHADMAGVPGYWIAAPGAKPPDLRVTPVACGTLDDFLLAARSGELEAKLAAHPDGGAAS